MSTNSSSQIPNRSAKQAALGVAAFGLAGLIAALIAYLSPTSGVDHTGGALTTVISTILIVGAAVYLALSVAVPRLVTGILDVLLILGLALTLVAGVLLMNWWLVAAMACGIVVEALRLVLPGRPARPAVPKGT